MIRDASFRRDGITGQLPTLLEGHPGGIRLADFRSTEFAGLATVLINHPRATVRSALVAGRVSVGAASDAARTPTKAATSGRVDLLR